MTAVIERAKTGLAEGPVVLVFYRGSWCPYCNMHLRAITAALPEIERRGASVIAITPQTPDRSASQIDEEGYPFEVLSDLDASVMQADIDYKTRMEPADIVEALDVRQTT